MVHLGLCIPMKLTSFKLIFLSIIQWKLLSKPRLGSHIFDVTKIPCQSNEFVFELLRGVRIHVDRFIENLKAGDLEKAQLALGHSCSRARVISPLYVLLESPSGYALFECFKLDDVGHNTEAVRNSVTYFSRFSKVVRLVAFNPFDSDHEALTQISVVSEGQMTSELHNFLASNLPEVMLRDTPVFTLGVANLKLGSHIFKVTRMPCQSSEFVLEILRGVRLHIHRFIETLKPGDLEKPHQPGLSKKVDFNINCDDSTLTEPASKKSKKRKCTELEDETSVETSNKKRKIKKQVVEVKPLAERDFPSGFVIQELEIGVGELSVARKMVSISYTARLMDSGQIFESYTRKAPFSFQPGRDQVVMGLLCGVLVQHLSKIQDEEEAN